MPELDINASADEVARLFNQGQSREAATRLDALRQGQSQLVQEALDRSVASRAAERIDCASAPRRAACDRRFGSGASYYSTGSST